MVKIIDCVSFNGEYDLLEIRLNILNKYVDEFIIVEAPTTFSGKPKPFYFELSGGRYDKWLEKIRYFKINEVYSQEEIVLAESSLNTKGASHWKHEFLQKESIKKALTHLKDDDIVFISDCDEVWNPEIDPELCCFNKHNSLSMPWHLTKLQQLVYTYFLNNRSSEKWRGTNVIRYENIKNGCLNHIRTQERYNLVLGGGWHFTSMGGYKEVKRKLSDSYTRESYWTEEVENSLEQNIKEKKDFLGRNFTYKVDESEWPDYLKKNREKYAHLLQK